MNAYGHGYNGRFQRESQKAPAARQSFVVPIKHAARIKAGTDHQKKHEQADKKNGHCQDHVALISLGVWCSSSVV